MINLSEIKLLTKDLACGDCKDDLCPDCNAPMSAHDDGECPKFFEDCHEDLRFEGGQNDKPIIN